MASLSRLVHGFPSVIFGQAFLILDNDLNTMKGKPPT